MVDDILSEVEVKKGVVVVMQHRGQTSCTPGSYHISREIELLKRDQRSSQRARKSQGVLIVDEVPWEIQVRQRHALRENLGEVLSPEISDSILGKIQRRKPRTPDLRLSWASGECCEYVHARASEPLQYRLR